jgi:uncharacterized peroxidase-related enzyme
LSLAGVAARDAEAFVRELVRAPAEAARDPAEAAMLRYALKLTREPAAVVAGDAAALREAGFDDRAIHDICAITAYYAFVNRIADGLGVELEPRFGAGSQP